MGEAKSRSQARREAAQAGKLAPVFGPIVRQYEQVTIDVPKPAMAALSEELVEVNKALALPNRLTQRQYVLTLLMSALDTVRRLRLQAKAEADQARLVQPATAAQVQQVLGATPADFPRPRPVAA